MTIHEKVIRRGVSAAWISISGLGRAGLFILTATWVATIFVVAHSFASEKQVPAKTTGAIKLIVKDSANGTFDVESGIPDSSGSSGILKFCPLELPGSADLRTGGLLRLVEEKSGPSEPDISKPGADFGDYPNSAYTLPKGRAYLEFAPITYQGPERHNYPSINTAYLFRYGVTDDVEFRLTGSGLTSVFDPGTTVTGFAPLIVDTKIHLWDDKIEKLIPAASFEAFIQTNLASPEFQSGYQPSVNLNLDFPFTSETNVEMTFGFTGVQDAVHVIGGERFIPRFGHNVPTLSTANLNVNVFSYQWAVEHQVTEKFQVFLQGYYNGDVFRQTGAGKVIGAGYFYQFNKISTFYNSYNAGLDQNTPNFSTQVGFAVAF